MIQRLYLILLFSVLLPSCANDGDATNSAAIRLDGSWISNCYSMAADEPGELGPDHTIDVFRFSGTTFTTSYQTWSNSSCSGAPMHSRSLSGTYKIKKPMITASGQEAVEVDFYFKDDDEGLTVLDIIRFEGDQFNLGVFVDRDTRSSELDANVLFKRQ